MEGTRLRVPPVLVLLAATFAGGCGEGPERGPGAGGPEEPFRVALLTSGPVSDAGWYAGAYEGLLLVRDSLGAEISHQQTRTPAEFDEAFIAYATSGYRLIFAHGFEYQDAALRAGERFPDVTFVVSAGGKVARNVVPLIFTLEEATYLAGIVAGAVTRTGVVGMIGGVAIPPVRGTFRAFEAGVRVRNQGVRVLETYLGSWDDVAAAKEAALAQIRRGADVLIHNTDAASFGVFQAAREATGAGDTVWVIGTNRDQNDVAPEVTLGSAVIRIPAAFLRVARAVRDGSLVGAPIFAGLREGVVEWVPNPAAAGRIPPDAVGAVAEARRGILSGSLRVPRVEFVETVPPPS